MSTLDSLHKLWLYLFFVFKVFLLPVGEKLVFCFQEVVDVAQFFIHFLQHGVLVQDALDVFVL